jgi:hypothetical protein
MPLYVMDCYYRSSPYAEAVLRESVEVIAPALHIAIEEAHRRAQVLLPTYFELRDTGQRFDNLFYNSDTGEG